jgi:hypothetical protein
MPKGLFHDQRNDHQEAQETEGSDPFPVELIDQLLAQVENKDAESILGESGLAGQLKKMLAERVLSAELTHHLASEGESSRNHRNGTSPKKVLTPAVSSIWTSHATVCRTLSPSWSRSISGA